MSLWLKGNFSVRARTAQSSLEVVITIITVQEVFNGWMGRLNNLPDLQNLAFEYENLWQTVEFIRSFRVLKFDSDADDCYVQILQANPFLRKTTFAARFASSGDRPFLSLSNSVRSIDFRCHTNCGSLY
ncbi:MAG: type II toxin-antitoxin system VapC family toxin [Acaryochloridaceae cyanobacterium RU_4_10]|nr:type II toxin-antitoxin system VapC family toxin [Acaryochloridaceae cyanobacterium RU_4_10]